MFFEISVLKTFAIFTGKQLLSSLFLMKLWAFRPAASLKIDSEVLSYEYCEILKKIYFEEHLRMTASILQVLACFDVVALP